MLADPGVVDLDEAAGDPPVVVDQPVTNPEDIHAMPHPAALCTTIYSDLYGAKSTSSPGWPIANAATDPPDHHKQQDYTYHATSPFGRDSIVVIFCYVKAWFS